MAPKSAFTFICTGQPAQRVIGPSSQVSNCVAEKCATNGTAEDLHRLSRASITYSANVDTDDVPANILTRHQQYKLAASIPALHEFKSISIHRQAAQYHHCQATAVSSLDLFYIMCRQVSRKHQLCVKCEQACTNGHVPVHSEPQSPFRSWNVPLASANGP